MYLGSLTEMEKYTLFRLFGKKPGWIKKHVQYSGPVLKLQGGQEYRAVSADDIFGMNQPPEDDVFDLGPSKPSGGAKSAAAPAEPAKPAARAPAAGGDDFFKDHYWDTPDEEDPFDLGTPSEGLGQEDTQEPEDGADEDSKE